MVKESTLETHKVRGSRGMNRGIEVEIKDDQGKGLDKSCRR